MRNILLVVVLLAILAGAVVFAYEGLSEGGDTSIGVHGRIASFPASCSGSSAALA